MGWILGLGLVLATPPLGPLGEGLDRIGAFEPALDPSLRPPQRPARLGARGLILAGTTLMAAGLAGLSLSTGCATRSADGGCVDPRGSAAVFPALLVLGLGITTTGAWWLRRDLPAPPEGQRP